MAVAVFAPPFLAVASAPPSVGGRLVRRRSVRECAAIAGGRLVRRRSVRGCAVFADGHLVCRRSVRFLRRYYWRIRDTVRCRSRYRFRGFPSRVFVAAVGVSVVTLISVLWSVPPP